MKKEIDGRKRSKTLSEVKPVEDISKNLTNSKNVARVWFKERFTTGLHAFDNMVIIH